MYYSQRGGRGSRASVQGVGAYGAPRGRHIHHPHPGEQEGQGGGGKF